jgi:L-alanine-DL-glutamate epimerase-like enolase superfamily enzyme
MDRIGNMRILEDPFPRNAYHQFADLRHKVEARVVCHLDPPDAISIALRSDAAGGFNIDSHSAGLFNWRSTAAIAEGANLAIWHGSGLDLGIATAAQLQLAASAPNCTLPGDQASAWLREHMLIAESFEVKDGTIAVPPGPGLGVTLDEDALAHYAVETWG